MFAPPHHQATRYVIPVRSQLAVRTIFNFLGPLTNPAGATRQLIGVSDPAYLETMAGALALLGTEHALLVSGEDGLDELSISAPTASSRCVGGELRDYTVTPEERRAASARRRESIPGGDPQQNAATTRRIFAGEPGPARDLAVLNAGAAIYAGGARRARSPTASRGRARRSTAARRPRRSSGSSARTQELALERERARADPRERPRGARLRRGRREPRPRCCERSTRRGAGASRRPPLIRSMRSRGPGCR